MNSAPVSPLRQRMIEDMTIRQFRPKSQHDYIRVVADPSSAHTRLPVLSDTTSPRAAT